MKALIAQPPEVDGYPVQIVRGRPVTTSLQVAEQFHRPHAKVLRAIRDLECSTAFTAANFGLSDFTDSTGRALPLFLITRDGFTFLAMGFTGKKAAAFKERYIDAFNQMELALLRRQNDEWKEVRAEGKATRRVLTDTLAEFVEYAEDQGSSNARRYYSNVSKMTSKTLFLIGKGSPKPFRDMLDQMQLSFLVAGEHVAKEAFREGMAEGLHYKDIYRLARDRVEALAAALPRTRLLSS